MSRFLNDMLGGHRYAVVSATTVADYAARTGAAPLFRSEADAVAQAVRYVGDGGATATMHVRREISVCRLDGCSVVGGQNLILGKRGGRMLYDQLCACRSHPNYRMTDRVLKKHHRKPVQLAGHYVLHYLDRGRSLDAAVSLVGCFSTNYYHFIYEVVSRLYLLTRCNIPADVPLVLDAGIRAVPQLLELLHLFAGERPVEFLAARERMRVGHLYVLSAVNHIVPNYVDIHKAAAADNLFCTDALDFVRRRFLDFASRQPQFPRRIYIVRRHTANRHYNEQELVPVAKACGFEAVSPEELSIADQFAMFAHAECIIAASGAALSNIICCRPGCRVLVLFSHAIDLSIFSGIAAHLDIDLRYLTGKAEKPHSLQSAYTVDAGKFRESITEWLIR